MSSAIEDDEFEEDAQVLWGKVSAVLEGKPIDMVGAVLEMLMVHVFVHSADTVEEADEIITDFAREMKEDMRAHWNEIKAQEAAGDAAGQA